MNNRRHVLGSIAGAAALCSTPHRLTWAQAGSKLVFGLISPRAVEVTKEAWAPFISRLGGSLGVSVESRVFPRQDDLVKAFGRGEIDLAWLGNAPALEVVESGKGAVFAQMVLTDGTSGYKSVLVVPDSSPVKDLKGLIAAASGLNFSNGDPKSTSGFLVPYYFAFQKSGVNDTKALFKSETSGSHSQNLQRVAKGEVDVATANTEELVLFSSSSPDLHKAVRVIWESPLIPQSPLLWKTSLPIETRRKIQSFVFGFGDKNDEERGIMKNLNNLSRFRPSSSMQLVPIADLEMFKARQAINNDKSLTADERVRRIEAVIARASKLEIRLKLSAAYAN